MKTNLHYVLSFLLVLSIFSTHAQKSYWKTSAKTTLSEQNTKQLDQNHYQSFLLDFDAFKAQLVNTPLRGTTASDVIVSVPNFEGKLEPFRVVEAPVLSKELSEQHPNIKTYLGFSTQNPGVRVRFSVTPQGLQTMVSSPSAPLCFTVPTRKGDVQNYIAYSRQARINSVKDFTCSTNEEFMPIDANSATFRDANDQVLRTLRIAISTTGNYTQFWDDGDNSNGDSQADALAQVVSTLNRTNEVFEVDMAVTFTLVSGTNIIYTDPNTDPYTGSLNADLQTTLTAEIGEANYDIGHLFEANGDNGNAGCIGCVCVDGQKGSAFSSHSFSDNDGGPFMNDFFDIDYVPHEIGHQMGGNHTWSFSSEGTGVNMEPGSGTTIMGYAGITGGNDVQDHSDPYFHYASIDQILDNLEVRTCWTSTTITNNPPVANAGPDYIIPTGTAFVLKGNATDADAADVLTYSWEQIDDGQTTNTNFGPNKANGAVWRSRPPNTSPDRYMPLIQRVIDGQLTENSPIETVNNTSWETVSTVGRTLNFALTVRDRSETNGVGQFPQSSFDEMQVTVDDTAGPFVVTSQNTTQTWDAGSTQTVTWDVAGTDTGNVNTSNVNILISTDGGFTFPHVMATNVPNNGSFTGAVPFVGADSSTVRVKVEGVDNIFYAINATNISIQESEFVLAIDDTSVDICSPDDVSYTFTYNTFLGFSSETTFSASGLPTGTTATFSPVSAMADGTEVSVLISGTGALSAGNYPFQLQGTSGSITNSTNVEFNVFDTNFSPLTINTPIDGTIDINPDSVEFAWSSDINATAYEIEIATDAAFTNIVAGGVPNNTMFTIPALNSITEYFWRVRAVNDCGEGDYVQASFTTADIVCSMFNSTDTPLAIPDNSTNGVNSEISITTPVLITDVNVTVNITHTWVSDLTLTLISPNGEVIVLSANNGAAGDNYEDTVFDQEATTAISTTLAPFTGSFIPEGDLSLLYGTTSGGVWTLNVADDTGFDTGNIDNWSLEICGSPLTDTDGDGIPNDEDNCPDLANTDQSDIDGDGIGDVCDNDIDGDDIPNDEDNCPINPNTNQNDFDGNGIGDACDSFCNLSSSTDVPVTIEETENAVDTYLVTTTIEDPVLITDVIITINIDHVFTFDLDIFIESPDGTIVELSTGNGEDGDNYTNTIFSQNATTSIASGAAPFTGTFLPEGNLNDFTGLRGDGEWTLIVNDTFGLVDGGVINAFEIEVCGTVNPNDYDFDGIPDEVDNCVFTANSNQSDIDNDGIGDVCDEDADNDGLVNNTDNCPLTPNSDQSDIDNDGIGDVCDEDIDNDGILNPMDNCPSTPNSDQADEDGNGVGDVCDGLTPNNTLTPNGDSINDTWIILNVERYPNAIIKVYNRWSNEVFNTTNYKNDWNGTYNGDTLPTGSYYYVIDQNGDGATIINGWIYLTL